MINTWKDTEKEGIDFELSSFKWRYIHKKPKSTSLIHRFFKISATRMCHAHCLKIIMTWQLKNNEIFIFINPGYNYSPSNVMILFWNNYVNKVIESIGLECTCEKI